MTCTYLYSKADIKQIDKYTKIFYNIMEKAMKEITRANLLINKYIGVEGSIINENKWIPNHIDKYINERKKNIYEITTVINKRNINLQFVCFIDITDDDILYYTTCTLLVIYLLSFFSNVNCSKNMKIRIFLTPFKKVSPKDINQVLDIAEVNTGYSTVGCNDFSEITIYREEEWFKVLIHELMHNFDLDFSSIDYTSVKENISKLFIFKSNYEISETYAESWGRIINVMVFSYQKTNNFINFSKDFLINIDKERAFSLQQANIILERMKNTLRQEEKTNVFCYYILTSAILNNYLRFFNWCNNNNNNLLDFTKQLNMVKNFMDLVIESIQDPIFIKSLSCTNYLKTKELENSLRMTIINAIK